MKKKSLLKITSFICLLVSVLFFGRISTFADVIKPIHEYKFDGESNTTVIDSGSKKIDGLSSGTNHETFFTGYNGTGKARYFNGTDDALSFEYYQYKPKGAVSIRFKMKKDASTFSNEKLETIMNTGGNNFRGGYFIGIGSEMINDRGSNHPVLTSKNGTLYIAYFPYEDKLSFEIQSPENVCDGQWHDILFTWDGTTNTNSVKLYLDDMTTPVAQTTPLYEEVNQITNLGIGTRAKVDGAKIQSYWYNGYLDDIQIYNTAISPNTDTSNLKAVGGDSKVDLTWNAVTDATSYTIKRSTIAGGPYTTIATGVTGTSYTDTDVTNGTTYYYVVTAIINGSEGWSSNEASATPTASVDPSQPTGNKALLVITMVTGERKEYEMAMDKINDFISWYNSKAASSPTYVIEKDYNKASFTSRKDYIAYDQISNFEVNEYNE
ncbi:LamG-like jellyroll fold domain-containing protein [Clostridium sp. Marseille-P2415]|uniref:LamG-like jellyroll fold domain-containing protein n=1 Tax=Clostridium sp. Marseille-P2415 TaxID=1805471 RepID=UPI0009888D4C|nr:LamG-like jellyroll fold domain-containing protein [Clostridium sp. Marseille-P2415]